MKEIPEKKSSSVLPVEMTTKIAVILVALALFFSLLIQFIPLDAIFPDEDERTVRLHYADNMSPTHLKIIESFNKKYEGRIEIIPIDLPFYKFTTNERKELLVRSLRSRNNRIDIFSIDLIWVPRFKNWALPLTDYLQPDFRKRILPFAYEQCIEDGEVVCLPMYLDAGYLIYRQDVLDSLGKPDLEITSWEEMAQLPPNSYLFQAKAYEGLMCNFYEKYRSDLKDHGDSLMAVINTLEYFNRLINVQRIVPQEALAYDEMGSYIHAFENDIPIFRAWFSIIEDKVVRNMFPEKIRNIRLSLLPESDWGNRAVTWGGWDLMINSRTEFPQEAVTFLQYILEDSVQQTIFDEGKYLPVIREFYSDSLRNKKYQLDHLFQDGVYRPRQEDYTLRSDHIVNIIHQVLENNRVDTTSAQEILTLLNGYDYE